MQLGNGDHFSYSVCARRRPCMAGVRRRVEPTSDKAECAKPRSLWMLARRQAAALSL